MPFVSTRAQLSLTGEDEARLRQLSQSRKESVARVQRAQILLRYARGETVSVIAAALDTNRPKVERCISKALQLGGRSGLQRFARSRPAGAPQRGRLPASRLPRSMSDRDPPFMSRWTARSSACSPCSFVIVCYAHPRARLRPDVHTGQYFSGSDGHSRNDSRNVFVNCVYIIKNLWQPGEPCKLFKTLNIYGLKGHCSTH